MEYHIKVVYRGMNCDSLIYTLLITVQGTESDFFYEGDERLVSFYV
jgi:hypothetical protein